MKVAVLILAVAVIGAFADDTASAGPAPFVCDGNAFVCKMKELWHHTKYHATKLGKQLLDVGSNVAGAAVDQATNLLKSGAQAVAGTVLEHLNKEGLVGKREVAFFDKVKSHVQSGVQLVKEAKDKLHGAFKTAVSKLMGKFQDMSALKQVDEDADKEIDAVVDDYKKEGKKGFFGMAKAIAGKMSGIFKAGMEHLKARFGKKVEERAILDTLSGAWNKAKDTFSNLAGGIADTFKPHLDTLNQGIKSLGDKLKEHGGNLVDAAKGHFNKIKDSLSGHIDTLKGHAATLGGHAVNAVNALKEAIASIAKQTLDNAAGTVGDIVQTGKDAAGVVASGVGDAISGY